MRSGAGRAGGGEVGRAALPFSAPVRDTGCAAEGIFKRFLSPRGDDGGGRGCPTGGCVQGEGPKCWSCWERQSGPALRGLAAGGAAGAGSEVGCGDKTWQPRVAEWRSSGRREQCGGDGGAAMAGVRERRPQGGPGGPAEGGKSARGPRLAPPQHCTKAAGREEGGRRGEGGGHAHRAPPPANRRGRRGGDTPPRRAPRPTDQSQRSSAPPPSPLFAHPPVCYGRGHVPAPWAGHVAPGAAGCDGDRGSGAFLTLGV